MSNRHYRFRLPHKARAGNAAGANRRPNRKNKHEGTRRNPRAGGLAKKPGEVQVLPADDGYDINVDGPGTESVTIRVSAGSALELARALAPELAELAREHERETANRLEHGTASVELTDEEREALIDAAWKLNR